MLADEVVGNNSSDESSGDDLEKEETRELVKRQNRKAKKSGGFQSMGLSHKVFKGIFRKGYKIPTPIQRKAIPMALDGRDLIGMARTGSGKTAAFVIPILERLKQRDSAFGPRAIIISPTRELALQTAKVVTQLAKFTDLHVTVIVGGDTMDNQFFQLDTNPDIVVATPGRLMHLLVEMDRKLSHCKIAVFDEADKLFEMGFSEQLNEIIDRITSTKQIMLFSATLPSQVVDFAKVGLRNPELVRLDVEKKLSQSLRTAFVSTRNDDKIFALVYLLSHVIKRDEKCVIFVATKHHVELLRMVLERLNFRTCYIYSSLDPLARKTMINDFRSNDETNKYNLMLVTDICSRGIDIPLLDCVVNFNFPPKAKTFIHRVGRVARAGRPGTAYSFVSNEELPYLLDLHSYLGKPLSLCSSDDKDWDGALGRLPQTIIDDEAGAIMKVVNETNEISTQYKSAQNAEIGYKRTNEKASKESLERAKKLHIQACGLHPLFGEETSRQNILDYITTLKPKTTIFEVDQKKSKGIILKKNSESRMRNLKNKNDEKIKKFAEQKKMRINQLKMENESKQTNDAYVPYERSGATEDKYLKINSFQTEAVNAALDASQNKHVSKLNTKIWDRKKKKFVSTQSGNKKQIKTESGNWIKSSFKTGKYDEYRKQNIESNDNFMETGETQSAAHVNRQRLEGIFNARRRGKVMKKSQMGTLFKPEKILKQRKMNMKKQPKTEKSEKGKKSSKKFR